MESHPHEEKGKQKDVPAAGGSQSSRGGMVRGEQAIMKDPEEHTGNGDGPPGGHGSRFGEKVKGLAAQTHGLGESFRGNVGAALDSMTGCTEGQARNEEIARRGRYEMHEKQFAPEDFPPK